MKSESIGILGQKYCSSCKTIKEVNEFHKNKATKDGICSWCKHCTKISVEIYKKKLNKPITGKYQWHRSNK